MRWQAVAKFYELALCALFSCILIGSVWAQTKASLPEWTREWLDVSAYGAGCVQLDPTGTVHSLRSDPRDSQHRARWIVRASSNQYYDPLSGQQWRPDQITYNMGSKKNPWLAFDARRNAYVVWESPGGIRIAKFAYTGGYRWSMEGEPQALSNNVGHLPRVYVRPDGAIVVSYGGSRDPMGQYRPNAILFSRSGNTNGPWEELYSTSFGLYDAGNPIAFDEAGNIHTIGVDNPIPLTTDYYYQKYDIHMNPIGPRIKVTNTNGVNSIRGACIAATGNKAYMAFQIGDQYRGVNECWYWTVSNGVSLEGPFNLSSAFPDFAAEPCLTAKNGRVVGTYMKGPSPQEMQLYAYYIEENLRSSALGYGYSHASVLGAEDSLYVTLSANYLWPDGRVTGGVLLGQILSIGSFGRVAGTAKEQSGAPIPGVAVTLAREGGFFRSTVTSMDGTYMIDALPPGIYTASATKPGFEGQSVPGVVVSGGNTTTVDFQLRRIGGKIVGVVTGLDGKPVPGVIVSANGSTSYGAMTTSDGSYEITNVALGDYAVTFRKFGYFKQTKSISLAVEGETKVLNITLSKVAIEDVKRMSDGTPAELTGKVITMSDDLSGFCYIEEPDRSSGIRVAGVIPGLSVGDIVDVSGIVGRRMLNNVASERQVVQTTITKIDSGNILKPLLMTCRAVGGGATTNAVAGVNDGVGLNNIGLFVTIVGKVVKVEKNGDFFVDDGSAVLNVEASGPTTGVRVCSKGPVLVSQGQVVKVSGIVTGMVPPGWTTNCRCMLTRSPADIIVLGEISGGKTDSLGSKVE